MGRAGLLLSDPEAPEVERHRRQQPAHLPGEQVQLGLLAGFVGAVELDVDRVPQLHQVGQHLQRRGDQTGVRGALRIRVQVLQRGRVQRARGVDGVLDRPPPGLRHDVTSCPVRCRDLVRRAEQPLDRLTEPRFQHPARDRARGRCPTGEPPLELALGDEDLALAEPCGLLGEAPQNVALGQAHRPELLLQPGARRADGHDQRYRDLDRSVRRSHPGGPATAHRDPLMAL